MIFNEAELAGNKTIGNPFQGTTTPAMPATSTTNITNEESTHPKQDMEESPIMGYTYNAMHKAEFPKQGLQKAVGVKETPINQKAVRVKETPTNQEIVRVKETPTKQISVVVPH